MMTAENVRLGATTLLSRLTVAKEDLETWAQKVFPLNSVVSYPFCRGSQKFGRVVQTTVDARYAPTLTVVVTGGGYTHRIDPAKEDISPATEADLAAQDLKEAERNAKRKKKR